MWQLKIIIEISGRKELFSPIWALPGGQAVLFLSAYSFMLCPGCWEVLWSWPSLL